MKRISDNTVSNTAQKRPCVAVPCKTEEITSIIAHDDTPSSQPPSCQDFLCGVSMYILQAGIGKTRAELFQKQLRHYGGTVLTTYDPVNTTHVLVDEKMDAQRMCRIMKLDKPPCREDVCTVKSLWLSSCLNMKKLVDTNTFELDFSAFEESKSNTGGKHMEGNTQSNKKPTQQSCSHQNTSAAAVPSTSKEVMCANDNDEVRKVPKIGIMFNAFTKRGVKNSSGEDSDYEPSGGEEDKDDCLHDNTSESVTPKPNTLLVSVPLTSLYTSISQSSIKYSQFTSKIQTHLSFIIIFMAIFDNILSTLSDEFIQSFHIISGI